MRTEVTKGSVEIEVFRRFVQLSRLPIDPASIVKRNPPEPDILCTHLSEGPLAFEVTELCDPSIAKNLAEPNEGATQFLWTSDPSAIIVRKKLRKSYPVKAPVELLCYTDGRIITPDDVILPTVRPYFESWRRTFHRAWLLGTTGVHLICDAS